MMKISFSYLLVTSFCVIFSAVYEHYSHEVYSAYMIYSFAFPLFGGTLPFIIISIYRPELSPDRASLNLYNAGIATLTIGSIMKGVLEIYGTTNDLINIYWIAGAGFTGVGLLVYTLELKDSKKQNKSFF